MKKLLVLAVIGVVVASVMSVGTAIAASPVELVCADGAQGSSLCDADKGDDGSILGQGGLMTRIAQLFVYIAGIISIVAMTVAGLQYILAHGDPGQIQTAKNAALYSVIGLMVAVFAQLIVNFVLERL